MESSLYNIKINKVLNTIFRIFLLSAYFNNVTTNIFQIDKLDYFYDGEWPANRTCRIYPIIRLWRHLYYTYEGRTEICVQGCVPTPTPDWPIPDSVLTNGIINVVHSMHNFDARSASFLRTQLMAPHRHISELQARWRLCHDGDISKDFKIIFVL